MDPGALGALGQHVRNLIALRLPRCEGPRGVSRFWKMCVYERVREGGRAGGRGRERRDHTLRNTKAPSWTGTLHPQLAQILWVREALPRLGIVCMQQ